MSSSAAQAYARVATVTSTPREIEAKALLMAANKLHAVMTDAEATMAQTTEALMFNRKLWTIFLSEAQRDENPHSLEVRQNIANISVFVLSQTAALQISPQFAHFQPLIEISQGGSIENLRPGFRAIKGKQADSIIDLAVNHGGGGGDAHQDSFWPVSAECQVQPRDCL